MLAGSWTTKEEKTSTAKSLAYTYSNLSEGTTYYLRVIVVDGAGNQGKSAGDSESGSSSTTKVSNTPPNNLSTSLSSRTTSSLTIQARAYDTEDGNAGRNLTYTLSLNGQTKTASGKSGTYVTFPAVTGLSEYTTYSWTVTVKDSNGASALQNATGSDRTLCSGTIYSCSGYSVNGDCPTCSGYGYLVPEFFNLRFNNSYMAGNYGGYSCLLCGEGTRDIDEKNGKTTNSIFVRAQRTDSGATFDIITNGAICSDCWGKGALSDQQALKTALKNAKGPARIELPRCTKCYGSGRYSEFCAHTGHRRESALVL